MAVEADSWESTVSPVLWQADAYLAWNLVVLAPLSPWSWSKLVRVTLTSGIGGAMAHTSKEWSTPLHIWQGTILRPPWTVWVVWSSGSRIFHCVVPPELFWLNTESYVNHLIPLNYWDSHMISLMYRSMLETRSGYDSDNIATNVVNDKIWVCRNPTSHWCGTLSLWRRGEGLKVLAESHLIWEELPHFDKFKITTAFHQLCWDKGTHCWWCGAMGLEYSTLWVPPEFWQNTESYVHEPPYAARTFNIMELHFNSNHAEISQH